MKRFTLLVSLTSLATLLTTGCVTRMTEQLAIKHRAARSVAFAALTPEQQSRLERGVVEPGDSRDMVQVACGEPDRIERTEQGERWIYEAYLRPGDAVHGDAAPIHHRGKPTLIRAIAFRDGVVSGVMQRR